MARALRARATSGRESWVRALRALASPVPAETSDALAAAWSTLPEHARSARQYLGRQYAGCGATVGVMPRCDFACRGCYLGRDANRTPPLPTDEVKTQIRRLRRWLGWGGNLQITDGEVTLREPAEVIEILRYAQRVGLVPMLMTHGDTFLREPARFERLVREGGLREVAIHIDTTQRGRRDPRFRWAQRENDLMPLRDAFADLIRDTRRRCRAPIEVATTVTVTRDNLAEVPEIVAWARHNADAFKMLSFQPVAAVGRTEASLAGPVSEPELWAAIARGLAWPAEAVRAAQSWFGHPACNRFLQGAVWVAPGAPPRFAPLLDPRDPRDTALGQRALERWGGLTFRLDTAAVALARATGVFLRAPLWAAQELPAWAGRWLRRAGAPSLARALRDLARVHYLNIVSHHFMNAEELGSELGRERVASCAFRVAHGDATVSMCEVNASGLRDAWYRDIAETHHAAGAN